MPCGGDQVCDVEPDGRMNVHMFWSAKRAETGKEVPWEDGIGVGWLCWWQRRGRGLRAGKVGRTVCGVSISRAGM